MSLALVELCFSGWTWLGVTSLDRHSVSTLGWMDTMCEYLGRMGTVRAVLLRVDTAHSLEYPMVDITMCEHPGCGCDHVSTLDGVSGTFQVDVTQHRHPLNSCRVVFHSRLLAQGWTDSFAIVSISTSCLFLCVFLSLSFPPSIPLFLSSFFFFSSQGFSL